MCACMCYCCVGDDVYDNGDYDILSLLAST